MAAIIGSSRALITANFARAEVVSKQAARSGRSYRPLGDWLKGKKKKTQFTQGKKQVTFKEPAYNIQAQRWSGSVVLQGASEIKNGMLAEFSSGNVFWNTAWGFDDLRKQTGVTILPNVDGRTLDSRVERRDRNSELVLFDRITEDMESFLDRADENRDLLLHQQGSTADDIVGVNGLIGMLNNGIAGGLNIANVPALQHIVFAGNDGNGTAPSYMGARGIIGSTYFQQLELFIEQLRMSAATSGLPKGRFKAFAGSGWFQKHKYALRQNGLHWHADAGAKGNVNMLLLNSQIDVADWDLNWDPTMDSMDVVASSEQGVAPAQLSVTFSGGGAARQARGLAYVSATGAITSVIITDFGSGDYTSSPTVTIGNAGSGSGATFQAYVYSASAGTGLTQVDGDDVRIGRLASVVVTAAGANYPAVSIAQPFTDRLVVLYEPAWEYYVQDGLDMYLSQPADNARARMLEQQLDLTHLLLPLCLRCNGVFAASST